MSKPLSKSEFDVVYNTLNLEKQRATQMAATHSPQLSSRVSEIYRNYPMLPGGVVLSAAKAGLSNEQLNGLAEKTAQVANSTPDALNPKMGPAKTGNKSLWDKTVDKVKTGSRWTMAALNLPLEVVQNAASQVAKGDINTEGFWASTELGTMMMDDDKSGSGYFVGGKAKENQGNRTREYRGTVNGHAWTVGRGLASVALPDNSLAFNLMSGLVDGGIAVFLPVVPGASQAGALVKGAGQAPEAGKFLSGAADIVGKLSREGGIIAPSLRSAEDFKTAALRVKDDLGDLGDQIDLGKFNKFLGTAGGQRLIGSLRDANTLDDVYKATNNNLYLDTAVRLRDAKTDADIAGVLIDTLGKESGLASTRLPGAKFFQSKTRIHDYLDQLPLFSSPKTRRLMGKVPEQTFSLDATDPLDQRRAIKAIDNWMKQALVPDDLRKATLDEAADAIIKGTPTAKKAFTSKYEGIVKDSISGAKYDELGELVSYEVHPDIVEALFTRQRDVIDKSQKFNLDQAGNATDSGFYLGLAGGEQKYTEGVLMGPQNAAELARSTIEMPDPRQVRRLTSNMGWVVGKSQRGALKKTAKFSIDDPNLALLREAGELRLPFAFVDAAQQLWRTTTLATVAYGVRNMAEGQARLALNNGETTSIFRHPLQHIMWATGTSKRTGKFKKGAGDILGDTWDGVPVEVAARRTQREYTQATKNAGSRYHNDPVANHRRAERTGDWQLVTKGESDIGAVVQGHGDQIGKLNADLVNRLIAAGASDDEIKIIIGYGGRAADDAVMQKYGVYLGEDSPQEWYRDMADAYSSGRSLYLPSEKRFADESVSVDLGVEHNFDLYMTEARQRVKTFTNDRGDLRSIVSTGKLPEETLDAGKFVIQSSDVGQVIEIPVYDALGKVRGRRAVLVESLENGEATVRAFAFRQGENTGSLRKFLAKDDVYFDKNLPTSFGRESRAPAYTDKKSTISKRWDETVNGFFAHIYTKPAAFLEQSPAFRQQYYNWIDRLVPSMDDASLQQLVRNVEERAAELGTDAVRYVGGAKRWKNIQDHASGTKKAYQTLSLDQVDAFAKGNALDDLKRILYDASERNNLTDIARVVMPFAEAQIDFFKAAGRMASVKTGFGPMPNIENIRKGQLIIEGGREADPDNDGQGFFFEDPQTGAWSFSYPLGGGLSHLATKALGALPGPFQGAGQTALGITQISPVSGFLQGISFKPGIGPIGQFATSAILPDAPQFDAVRNFLLPFGETAFKGEGLGTQLYKSFTPSWATKVISGLTDRPEGSSIYANTFMETYQALSSTGKFDLTTPQGQDDLYQEAKSKARALTVMRGFIQFSGPSRAVPDFEILTKEGDVMSSVLTQEFFAMQNDKQEGGYATAVQRFLDRFGDDAFIYMGSKTKAAAGGLSASTAFGNFERENGSLFRKYKGVAAFFAPGGDDFSFQVYARQLQTGQRERLTPQEMLEQAQRTVGFMLYKNVRQQAGQYPNQAQREYLSKYREVIGKKYPGFLKGDIKTDAEKTAVIDELRDAASDPSLKGNKTAEAVNMYLNKREEALNELGKLNLKSLAGKQAEPLRDYLRNYGEAIVVNYPEFGRVWERLLINEVDLTQ